VTSASKPYRRVAAMIWLTVALTASSQTDASYSAGVYRATVAAWSSDRPPARNVAMTVGRSPARRANRTTVRAVDRDAPVRHINHCTGVWIRHPSHHPSARAVTTRSTNAASAAVRTPAVDATAASKAHITSHSAGDSTGDLMRTPVPFRP
jgi:hypothetical protein